MALIGFLKDLRYTITRPVRILVASRNETDIYNLLHNLSPSSIDVPLQNTAAIELLITTRVTESRADARLSRLYTLGSEDVPGLVVEKLLLNAGGMFRWVQLAFDYLHRSRTARELRDRVDELHKIQDLFKLYDQTWKDIMQGASERRKRAIETALRMTIYGGFSGNSEYQATEQATTFADKKL